MNPLLKRTISGIIFVVLILEATVATTWSFYGIWTIIGILSLAEYYRLIKGSSTFRYKSIPYALGTLYIALPIALITQIDPMMVVTFLTIVWANDTGAFIVGSTIGKHKMMPKISPKKSWEGFFGGLVFAIGVAVVWYSLYWNESFGYLFQDSLVIRLRWIAFGAVISLAAVMGDMIESKFKRTIGVKDSGSLIPGHGGMLDRFDATLLAAPFAWIFTYFIL